MGGVTQERQELSQGRTFTEKRRRKKEGYGSSADTTGLYNCRTLIAQRIGKLPRVRGGGPSRKVADVGLWVFSIFHTSHDYSGKKQPCGS